MSVKDLYLRKLRGHLLRLIGLTFAITLLLTAAQLLEGRLPSDTIIHQSTALATHLSLAWSLALARRERCWRTLALLGHQPRWLLLFFWGSTLIFRWSTPALTELRPRSVFSETHKELYLGQGKRQLQLRWTPREGASLWSDGALTHRWRGFPPPHQSPHFPPPRGWVLRGLQALLLLCLIPPIIRAAPQLASRRGLVCGLLFAALDQLIVAALLSG